MTLLSYQVFQTVVGQGSFQKAAEILNLTPSAVSHAIASMEQELGFSLFTRNKAGVALTNYGEHLLPYVNAVLNSDESLQQAIAGLNGLKMGNVKVGCFSSVCTNWMTDIIHSFHQRYPDINIELYQGTYADVSYWIHSVAHGFTGRNIVHCVCVNWFKEKTVLWTLDFSPCLLPEICQLSRCTVIRCSV